MGQRGGGTGAMNRAPPRMPWQGRIFQPPLSVTASGGEGPYSAALPTISTSPVGLGWPPAGSSVTATARICSLGRS